MKLLIAFCLVAAISAGGYGRVPVQAPVQGPVTMDDYGAAPKPAKVMRPRPAPAKVMKPRPASDYGTAQAAADVQQQSAVEAANAAIESAVAQGANRNNFGIQTNAQFTIATSKNVQSPVVWDALDLLRGKATLAIEEVLQIVTTAVAGTDYPVYNDIPNTGFSCESVKQAGYYADTEAQCQVIRRCDINGVMWSYLCPNMTLFNQITLVCDYFFNIDCSKARQFYDYSNPRLYTQFVLLDDGEPTSASGSGSSAADYSGGSNDAGYGPAPKPARPAVRPSVIRPMKPIARPTVVKPTKPQADSYGADDSAAPASAPAADVAADTY